MKRVYLDHAATTPLDPLALDAMMPFLRADGEFGNASSMHSFGQKARAAVDQARADVAALLGARDSEIVFTGSGTEADNAAVRGALESARAAGSERRGLVTTAIEHHAVLNTAKALEREGFPVTIVPATPAGVVDLAALDAAITDRTALVSAMSVNNETGAVQPVRDVAAIAKARGALVHTDAVQAVGKIAIDLAQLDVDLLCLSAHKIYGPKGVGALYVRSGTRMAALLRGGSQERNRRAGTENVAGIAGLGRAARIAGERLTPDAEQIGRLRDTLERELLRIPGAARNGDAPRIASTTNVSFEGLSGEDLLIALDLDGVAVSTGAACAAGSPEPSHVLTAMGLSRSRIQSSLRFSLGRSTTADDVARAAQAVGNAVDRLRSVKGSTVA